MKKFLAIVLVLATVLCLCACGDTTNEPKQTEDNATQQTTLATEDDGKVTYTVKVVDEEGNPIAGAMVQLCLESCIPGKTDEQGVATYKVAEADYKVSFMVMPTGYSADAEAFYFAAGAYDLTITLKKAA